uniref:MHYT domain-containing protein n=1 Tax=Globisporangium ultimum (strain ATCC 200006 / CBS 805.95 / DAOM BR144) TaxID=431595 RepID=K3WIP6_GLOUD
MSDNSADNKVTMIYQHWRSSKIMLACFVSATESYCAIQTMEDWQQVKTRRQKLLFLGLMSLSLGGCSFWCTNFMIQSGLELRSTSGVLLPTDYELGWLVLSMVSVVGGVFLGLMIASRDPVFRNKEFQRHQKATLERTTAWPASPDVQVKSRKNLMLFSSPSHILAGAFCITLGIIGMHYAEMEARKSNAAMDVCLLTVVVSGVIEVLAVIIMLWTIFRAPLVFDSDDFIQAGTSIAMGLVITMAYYMAMTIQLMEQWRRLQNPKHKVMMLVLAAVTLGGCGIWCTHFTGMTALKLTLDDGTILVVDFELGLTVLSLIFPVVGVLLGLMIASKDPFFLEIEQSRRKDMLVANLRKVKMSVAVKQKQIMALFSRLGRIGIGGAFAALGVLGMHYLGMLAQRMNANMELHADIVAVSVVVAFLTANAAFWIIFRALTFLPNNETLRMGSALIMGIAVCGTHYSGMGAATYTPSEEQYATTTQFIINGAEATIAASHGALLICYWLASCSVVRATRKTETEATTRHDPEAQGSYAGHQTTHVLTHQASYASHTSGQPMKKPAASDFHITHQSSARKVHIAPTESEMLQSEQI